MGDSETRPPGSVSLPNSSDSETLIAVPSTPTRRAHLARQERNLSCSRRAWHVGSFPLG